MKKAYYTGKKYPFYKSISYVISEASDSEMKLLAKLIKATKLQKGHYKIIAAWKKRLQEIHWQSDDGDLGVQADLRKEGRKRAKKRLEFSIF
ncbi:MAG: hypothetical protein Q8Q46_01530 [Candidatus Giovannonibacteria bacterium]|nr:hypothetical protein [Candidatus Giovannonibacteria bacterium]